MKIRQPTIKVLLVDDSVVVLSVLKKMLVKAPDIEVAGTASNGKDALELVHRLNPAVVCTDLNMPVMDGLKLTSEIMSRYPCPILVISAYVGKGSSNIFKLLEAGALDIVSKPNFDTEHDYAGIADEIISKIRILAGVHVFRRPGKDASGSPAGIAHPPEQKALPEHGTSMSARIVVIGASTGGPQAFEAILSRLPADYSLPIVCVQHISHGFLDGLMQWLSGSCALKIDSARDQEVPRAGMIYFPPEGSHLKFVNGKFVLAREPLYNGHRPSITVTMQSAARCYGSGVVGVLLTGMGNDGSEGMLEIARAKGTTIVQDEKSCLIFGMPKQAIAIGAARHILSLNDIPAALRRLSENRLVR